MNWKQIGLMAVFVAAIALLIVAVVNLPRCQPGDPEGPTIGHWIKIFGC